MDPDKLQLKLDEALTSLNRHQLTAAEKSYNDILADFKAATDGPEEATPSKSARSLKTKQPAKINAENIHMLVDTLSGLTDIHMKRARTSRQDALEWFRHYLQSVAYLQQVLRLCDSVPTPDASVIHLRMKYEQKLKEIGSFLGLQLEACVLVQKDGVCSLRTEWLDELVKHLQEVQLDNEAETENTEAEASPVTNVYEEPVPDLQEGKKKLPDFGRIHKALSRLVKNVSVDVRSRYRRKKLSEETLRKSVSCELVSILSPLNDDEDIMNLFEQIIQEDEEEERWMSELNGIQETTEQGETVEDMLLDNGEVPTETQSAPSSPAKGCSSASTPHRGNGDKSGTPARQQPSRPHTPKSVARTPNGQHQFKLPSSKPQTPTSSSSKRSMNHLPLVATGNLHIVEHSPCSEDSLFSSKCSSDELSGSNMQQVFDRPFSWGSSQEARSADDPCLLPGVLTLWKRYGKGHQRTGIATGCTPYRLPGFEEVSSLTEGSPCRVGLGGASATEPCLLAIYPMEGGVLLSALAWQLTQLAVILEGREQLVEAGSVLMYALGLLRQRRMEDRGLSAVIYQMLGGLRIRQSDLPGGLQLLEEARQRFESCDLLNWQIYCAEILLEQGKAYLLAGDEPSGSQTLFDHVLQVVRERMNAAEPGESIFDMSQQCTPEEGDDSDSSQGESYSLHVHEAAECFQAALSELQLWKTEGEARGDPDHCGALMIDALVCLGDCHTMTGDFLKAIAAYEDALALCKEVGGTKALRLNAHVLLMLGVANYLLGNLPKAAVMMETAHILRTHGSASSPARDFEAFFALCMLATTLYHMGQAHRCIVWCLRAYELFCQLYDTGDLSQLPHAPPPFIQQWFVLHCLLNLGHAYYTLDFNDKAERYLQVALTIISESAIEADTRQHVRILKTLGDCCAAAEVYESAVEIYQDALDKASVLEQGAHASTSLQNQLLNSMASVRVVLRQYHEAATCLELALDHQKQLESSIQGDLIGVEYQLGLTYMMSGEMDKAIDCFEDCLANMPSVHLVGGCEEETEVSPSHSVKSLGSSCTLEMNHRTSIHTQTKLGVLYHVKALMQEDTEFMDELLATSRRYHCQAASHNPISAATVHAANYLWQQGDYTHAAEILVPLVFRSKRQYIMSQESEVVFAGVGQAVLPEHLHVFSEDREEVVLPTETLGAFILALCYKELKMNKDLTDVIVRMYAAAKTTVDWTMLGFILMEIAEFYEAAHCFWMASSLRFDSDMQTFFDAAICVTLVLSYFQMIHNVVTAAFLHSCSARKRNKEVVAVVSVPETVKAIAKSVEWQDESWSDLDASMTSSHHTSVSSHVVESSDSSAMQDSLDAGYSSNESHHRTGMVYGHTETVYGHTDTMYEDRVEDVSMSQSSSEEEEEWIVIEEGVQDYQVFPTETEQVDDHVYPNKTSKTSVSKQVSQVFKPEALDISPEHENYQCVVEQTVQELQHIAGGELNANYSQLYTLVDQQLRENWIQGRQTSTSSSLTNSRNCRYESNKMEDKNNINKTEDRNSINSLRNSHNLNSNTRHEAIYQIDSPRENSPDRNSGSPRNQENLHLSPVQTQEFEQVYEKSEGYMALFGPKRNLSSLDSEYRYRPRKLLK